MPWERTIRLRVRHSNSELRQWLGSEPFDWECDTPTASYGNALGANHSIESATLQQRVTAMTWERTIRLRVRHSSCELRQWLGSEPFDWECDTPAASYGNALGANHSIESATLQLRVTAMPWERTIRLRVRHSSCELRQWLGSEPFDWECDTPAASYGNALGANHSIESATLQLRVTAMPWERTIRLRVRHSNRELRQCLGSEPFDWECDTPAASYGNDLGANDSIESATLQQRVTAMTWERTIRLRVRHSNNELRQWLGSEPFDWECDTPTASYGNDLGADHSIESATLQQRVTAMTWERTIRLRVRHSNSELRQWLRSGPFDWECDTPTTSYGNDLGANHSIESATLQQRVTAMTWERTIRLRVRHSSCELRQWLGSGPFDWECDTPTASYGNDLGANHSIESATLQQRVTAMTWERTIRLRVRHSNSELRQWLGSEPFDWECDTPTASYGNDLGANHSIESATLQQRVTAMTWELTIRLRVRHSNSESRQWLGSEPFDWEYDTPAASYGNDLGANHSIESATLQQRVTAMTWERTIRLRMRHSNSELRQWLGSEPFDWECDTPTTSYGNDLGANHSIENATLQQRVTAMTWELTIRLRMRHSNKELRQWLGSEPFDWECDTPTTSYGNDLGANHSIESATLQQRVTAMTWERTIRLRVRHSSCELRQWLGSGPFDWECDTPTASYGNDLGANHSIESATLQQRVTAMTWERTIRLRVRHSNSELRQWLGSEPFDWECDTPTASYGNDLGANHSIESATLQQRVTAMTWELTIRLRVRHSNSESRQWLGSEPFDWEYDTPAASYGNDLGANHSIESATLQQRVTAMTWERTIRLRMRHSNSELRQWLGSEPFDWECDTPTTSYGNDLGANHSIESATLQQRVTAMTWERTIRLRVRHSSCELRQWLGNEPFDWECDTASNRDRSTVEPLFYDHPQNQIGLVVKQGWSSTRGLIIL